MKEKKIKVQEPKKRIKGAKGRIIGKIIALLMALFMLLSVCSTVLFYLINR